jgi:hypothetical protein
MGNPVDKLPDSADAKDAAAERLVAFQREALAEAMGLDEAFGILGDATLAHVLALSPLSQEMAMTDWRSILPPSLASRQIAWESAQRMLRALNTGATMREIAEALGCSRERVRQKIAKALAAGSAPVSPYLEEPDEHAARALARFFFPEEHAAEQRRSAETAARAATYADLVKRLRHVAVRQEGKQRLQDALNATPSSRRFQIMASDAAIDVPRQWRGWGGCREAVVASDCFEGLV